MVASLVTTILLLMTHRSSLHWWIIIVILCFWIFYLAFQIYVDSKGESIDLLQLYGVRTQMGRYVALVMDNIFTKQEITTISLEELLEDQRYSIVKGKAKSVFSIVISFRIFWFLEAVRSRFKLNHEMLSVEWPTLHECILQKRRNEMKKNKKDVANTSTVTISQATAEEHCDY